MPTASPALHRKLWEERSVVVAFVLAVLVPGLGHLFQGRFLKGLIYLFGILGLFFWGVKLGEGVVVYNIAETGISKRVTLHYVAQFGAGIVSYPVLLQGKRVSQGDNRPVRRLEQPLNAPFTGRLITTDADPASGKLQGTIKLTSEAGAYDAETKGGFSGTLDGQPVELQLAGNFQMDRPISAGFQRTLECSVLDDKKDGARTGARIVGWIPRSIKDAYGVPPDAKQLQELTGRLGKIHELALVFTWIAGLLNILAIWDCVQGPAYGFGDEHSSDYSNEESSDLVKPVEPPLANTTATPV